MSAPAKIKLRTLKVCQLNFLIDNFGLEKKGTKNEKIMQLTEFLHADEVSTEYLESPEEDEMNALKEMVNQLAATVSALTVSVSTLSTNQTAEARSQSRGLEQSQSVIIESANGSATPLWKVRDAVEVLPEFDPLQKTISSKQFIDKSIQLKTAYGWTETVALFAVQQRLRGVAKNWLDAQNVFATWISFETAFLRDFPMAVNTADCHRELMKRKRKPYENLVQYYYDMLAIGRRGCLDDQAIVSYIIEGINDELLSRTLLAMQFPTCTELLGSLEKMSSKALSTQVSTSFAEVTKRKVKVENNDQDHKGPKCFNCNEYGHIAIKCSKPQKKQRCTQCQKVGHEAKDCWKKAKPSVAQIHETQNVVPPVLKTVKLARRDVTGFVDTGSDVSLLRNGAATHLEKQPTIKQLRGFGGSVVEVVQFVQTEIEFDQKRVNATLYLVDNEIMPFDLLLGRDVLCTNGNQVVVQTAVMQVQEVNSKSFNLADDLTSHEETRVLELLCQFDECFAERLTELGCCKSTEMSIEVNTDSPIIGKRYQVPFAQRPKLTAIINELQENNIIRPSTSPHAASVLLVKKANGEDRMCVDFRALNAVTTKKQYIMPIVEEQLSCLTGSVYFTTLDMTSGYYQVRVAEASKKYTAFITHEGLFEHNVMPFGLVNAPMVFQEMLVNIIRGLRNKSCIINYVDEVIIGTRTVEQNLEALEEFLQAVQSEGLTLRPSKCTFLGKAVKFLGHIIDGHGIKPGAEKTMCIDDFPTPTSTHAVRQFLGLTGFFRKFVRGYSLIASSLTSLLKKDAKFLWQDEHEQAFRTLKAAITKQPVLTLFDANKTHEVHTDASSIGLSGVLLQHEGDDRKAVFYFSRKCSEAEQRYTSHELEVLAIVETLERFRLYLLGNHFRVYTDCKAITTTKAITPLLPRVARWWLKLQEFDFECVHRAGSNMAHVDSLSRAPVLPPNNMTTVAENTWSVFSYDADWVAHMQRQDDALQNIVVALEGGDVPNATQYRADYVIQSGRLFRKLDGVKKLVIPRSIRWRIVKSSHDDAGHFGLEKTSQRVLKDFWFPRMRRYVKSYINSCPECCMNNAKGGKAEGQMHISEVAPMPFRCIHLDHLGPFPRSRRGFSYILVIVCAFSKYTILKAVRNTQTTPVISCLTNVMATFGLPLKIVTDRGTAFTSKAFEHFLSEHGIDHVKNAVRTPRANGQAERVNRTVLSSLKCSAKSDKEWDEALPTLQWCLNSQINSTTKYSPNDLVFSFNLRDVSRNRIVQALHNDAEASATDTEYRKTEAMKNINTEREKWKQRFDATHARPTKYAEGDLVMIEYVPTAVGTSHKLDPKYKGPYVVTKALDCDRYVIEDLPDIPRSRKRYTGIWASDRMKRWCTPPPDDDSDTESSREDEGSGEAEL